MNKNKKTIVTSTAILLGFFLAVQTAGAQTPVLKKAVEDIKGSIDLLINAKDNNTESLAFRLETFKKVIDLAMSEAKDLKVKVLAFETDDKKLNTWKENKIEGINAVIAYYENQEENLANEKDVSLESIKKTAQDFKDWRDINFRPLSDEIGNFFLIQQENKAIDTAQKRFQKINNDITKLKGQKIKNINSIDKYIKESSQMIDKSLAANKTAEALFWESLNATSTAITKETPEKIKTNASSTDKADAALEPKEPSIRDLVYASLNDLKETYQIFIEMSNSVRELLR